ncbi:hypothetical protein [Shewanella sp. SE1]|uniref:hypothetical protein n=1 Tax=Shewanella sp. SE1 TaxID=2705014 RepID=UPI00138F1454|nr:hypothetical protein [Shewanella sp. SE1]NDO73056.1 hypothetical protein [Shewanella sp. SE1]
MNENKFLFSILESKQTLTKIYSLDKNNINDPDYLKRLTKTARAEVYSGYLTNTYDVGLPPNETFHSFGGLLRDGETLCLGYVHHETSLPCQGNNVRYKIATKENFDKMKNENIFQYNSEYDVLHINNEIYTVRTCHSFGGTKSRDKINSAKGKMQSGRLLMFDIDKRDIEQYTDAERYMMANPENFTEILHKILPECGFDKCGWVASLSNSARVKHVNQPQLAFNDLCDNGFHVYYILSEHGYETWQHYLLKDTIEKRLFDHDLLKCVHNLDRETGLPNGTIRVIPRVFDISIMAQGNRISFEGDPIVPFGYELYTDKIKIHDGDYISLVNLPHEKLRDIDKGRVKAKGKAELGVYYNPKTNEQYDRDFVEKRFNKLVTRLTNSTHSKCINLSDIFIPNNYYSILGGNAPITVEALLELNDFDRVEGKISSVPDRTVILRKMGDKLTGFVPRLAMAISLSSMARARINSVINSHTGEYSRPDPFADHFKQDIIERGATGFNVMHEPGMHNIELVNGIRNGTLKRIVSRAIHGSGKSTAMVATSNKKNFTVVIAPLRALCRDILEKYNGNNRNLIHYEDYKRKIKTMKPLDVIQKYDGIVCCAPSFDSIWKSLKPCFVVYDTNHINGFGYNNPPRSDPRSINVVVDEIEAIVSGIFTPPNSSTNGELNKSIYSNPMASYNSLVDCLRTSETFFLGDADVGDWTVKLVEDVQGEYKLVRNGDEYECRYTGWDFTYHVNRSKMKSGASCYIKHYERGAQWDMKNHVVNMVHNALENGETTVLCSNSRETLVQIFRRIDKQYHDNCALVVGDKNNIIDDMKVMQKRGEDLTTDAINYINDNNIKLIGLSPRATNGLNIDLDESVIGDCIYIQSENVSYTHDKVIQHILRYRGKRDLHVFLPTHYEMGNRGYLNNTHRGLKMMYDKSLNMFNIDFRSYEINLLTYIDELGYNIVDGEPFTDTVERETVTKLETVEDTIRANVGTDIINTLGLTSVKKLTSNGYYKQYAKHFSAFCRTDLMRGYDINKMAVGVHEAMSAVLELNRLVSPYVGKKMCKSRIKALRNDIRQASITVFVSDNNINYVGYTSLSGVHNGINDNKQSNHGSNAVSNIVNRHGDKIGNFMARLGHSNANFDNVDKIQIPIDDLLLVDFRANGVTDSERDVRELKYILEVGGYDLNLNNIRASSIGIEPLDQDEIDQINDKGRIKCFTVSEFEFDFKHREQFMIDHFVSGSERHHFVHCKPQQIE